MASAGYSGRLFQGIRLTIFRGHGLIGLPVDGPLPVVLGPGLVGLDLHPVHVDCVVGVHLVTSSPK